MNPRTILFLAVFTSIEVLSYLFIEYLQISKSFKEVTFVFWQIANVGIILYALQKGYFKPFTVKS